MSLDASEPGTWREPDRDVPFPYAAAQDAWAAASITILEDVARTFGGYITYKDLGDRLFRETGVRTKVRLGNWIGKPLERVLKHCQREGLPALTALVVHSGDGMVGAGFNEFLRKAGRATIADPVELEWVAADERLKCYRIYCPDVPHDAVPMLTREYAARIRTRATELAAKPVCPTCGLQLPRSGQCDFCS